MRKKTIIIVFGMAFLLLIHGKLFAQSNELKNSTPEDRAKAITEWMQRELSLDSTLMNSVYDINLKYAKKNHDIMSSSAKKFKKYRDLKANSEAKDKELKEIFAKEQYDKYQQKKAELRDQMNEKIQENRNTN